MTWINVDGIHDASVIEKIGSLYEIHPLTLEDIANTDQRPKFEDYENYVVVMMKMLTMIQNCTMNNFLLC